tara:strand:- start:1316 stop:2041 length:726 start_codon:yes stop_codon:yes gene_type:complete
MVYIYTLLRRNEKPISARTSIINKYFLEKQGAFSGMNPHWKWDKWTNATVSGGELIGSKLHMRSEPMGLVSYYPNTISPALHLRLTTLFKNYLKNRPSDVIITEWLQAFGPLYITGPYQFKVEEFLKEAGHLWWTISVLDILKQQDVSQHKKLTISVPSPLHNILKAQHFPAEAHAKEDELSEDRTKWTTSSTNLLSDLQETIEHYLKKNTDRDINDEQQPNNLSGFIWILAHNGINALLK